MRLLPSGHPQDVELGPMLTAIPSISGTEQSSGHSSYNMEIPQIIISDTNTAVVNSDDWEIILMDINIGKTMVAYIARNSNKPEVWNLFIFRIDTTVVDSDIFDATAATGFDLSQYLRHQDIPATTFLSISDTGLKVAISFLPDQDTEPTTIEKPKCIVLKLSENLGNISGFEEIDFQGKAVFTDNEQLMFLNKSHLKIYDKYFKLKHSFDIAKLLETFDSSNRPTSTFRYNLDPPNAFFSSTGGNMKVIKYLMTMSQFMRQGILVLPLETKAHVWTIQYECVRLTTIFKEEKEQIVGISKNKRFLATYAEDTRMVNVYETDYGRKMYLLETQNLQDPARSFDVSSVHFSNDQFLTLVGVEKDIQCKSVSFEVWRLESLCSIYFGREAVNTHGTIQTFFEDIQYEFDVSALFVYYITYTGGTASLQNRYIDNSIHQTLDPSTTVDALNNIRQMTAISAHEENSRWSVVCADTVHDNGVMVKIIQELSGEILDMLIYGKCYRRVYGGRAHLLFFGVYTIQLWRLARTEVDTDELLFIHTFKSYDIGLEIRGVQLLSVGSDDFMLRVKVEFTEPEDPLSGFLAQEEVFIPLLNIYDDSKLNKATRMKHTHLKLRSACQSLFYLSGAHEKILEDKNNQREDIFQINDSESTGNQTRYGKYSKYETNADIMMKITEKIIQTCINYIMRNSLFENQYFKTAIGSDILTILSAFDEGDKFLYQILCAKELPIAIFSWEEEIKIYNLDIQDNALIRLIANGRYDMYELFFNRILSTAKTLGIGYISVLTDAMLYLQYFGQVADIPETRLLEISIERLKNLHMDLKWLPLSEIERDNIMNNSCLRTGGGITKSENALEQLEDGTLSLYRKLFYKQKYGELWAVITGFLLPKSWSVSKVYIGRRTKYRVNQINVALCIVPLLKFLSYERGSGDTSFNEESYDDLRSRFLKVAINREVQGLFSLDTPFLHSLLWYKWNHLSINMTLGTVISNILFFILFAVCVAFGKNVFDYVFVEEGFRVNGGYIFLLLWFFYMEYSLVVLEAALIVTQIELTSFGTTMQRIFNIVSLLLPAVSAGLLIKGSEYFEPVCGVTTLLLWVYGIMSLRVSFRMDSILLVTIKQMLYSMLPVFCLMLVVILAFTSSFVIMLGRKDITFFGDSPNTFSNAVQAFFSLWFCIFGVWDPVVDGDAGNDVLLRFLAFLFTVIIVLVFFNFIIAEMNSSIERIRITAKRIWLSEFAAIIAEYEIRSLSSFRCNRNNNPPILYYCATVETVNQQETELEESTNKLIEQIRSKYNFRTTIETTIDNLHQTLNHAESLISKRMTEILPGDMDKTVISSKIIALENQLKSLNEKLNTTSE